MTYILSNIETRKFFSSTHCAAHTTCIIILNWYNFNGFNPAIVNYALAFNILYAVFPQEKIILLVSVMKEKEIL